MQTPIDFNHFLKQKPIVPASCFVASGVQLIGAVKLKEKVSIWHNAVLRADLSSIEIGEETNIQDLCLLHVVFPEGKVLVGRGCTIGHSAILHACSIGNNVLVGMGSIVLDGAVIGDNVLLGAGSLVTPRTVIPAGSKAFGRPAKVVAQMTQAEIEENRASARRYIEYADAHKDIVRLS